MIYKPRNKLGFLAFPTPLLLTACVGSKLGRKWLGIHFGSLEPKIRTIAQEECKCVPQISSCLVYRTSSGKWNTSSPSLLL